MHVPKNRSRRSVLRFVHPSVCFIVLFLPFFSDAAPQIKQFFPNHPVLLGDPLTWTIRIQYPVWETYRITVPPCEGLEMKVDGPALSESNGQMTAYYRIRVAANSFSIKDVPSVLIVDQKGQSTVISGKPVVVQTISGNSMQIKNPPPLRLSSVEKSPVWLLWVLGMLIVSLALLIVRRFRERTPRRLLLRNLIRARADIQKGRMPPPIWRLLRSEFLWGFSAETYTPSQLKEMAQNHPQLEVIAASLLSLEGWRYSGSASWDQTLVLHSVESAIEIAARRAKSQNPPRQETKS